MIHPHQTAITEDFKEKRIGIAFPPKRHRVDLKKAAHFHFALGRKKLKDHQLPAETTKADGYILRKPEHWE